MNSNKPILFYSNYCQYSREILSILQKYNILDKVVLINISTGKYKIPSVISKVPSLYVNKNILSDSDLENFITNNLINSNNEKIEAFFPSEMNSGIGYSYSYLGDEGSEAPDNIKNSLMYIDEINNNKINTPDENDFLSNDSTVNMNKFKEQRELDIQKILNTDKNAEQRNFIR
jgi:hypothetical protein